MKALLMIAFITFNTLGQLNSQTIRMIQSGFQSFCGCCDEFTAILEIPEDQESLFLDSLWIEGHGEKIQNIQFANDTTVCISKIVPVEWRILKNSAENSNVPERFRNGSWLIYTWHDKRYEYLLSPF